MATTRFSHLDTPNSRTASRSPHRFKDSPNDVRDEDEDRLESEFDPMFPKSDAAISEKVRPKPSRRWRLIGSLSGLAVLIIMALLVAFHTNQAGEWELPPNPLNYLGSSDDYYDDGPDPLSDFHPLPTGPATQVNWAPAPTNIPKIRKGLVLASYKTQKVDWLQNLNRYTKHWEVYRYVADDPNTKEHKVPNELGREAMAFLSFIIDYYHDLPDYVVFTHGHDRTWHQPEHIIDKIMALNLTAVGKEDYVNLRCSMSPGCTEDTKFHFNPRNKDDHRPGMLIDKGFWNHQMKAEFGELPHVFGRRCCAQFAVTKKAIHFRTLDFWKSLRKPLEGNMDNIKKIWGQDIDKYRLGSMYEQIWHILFGKDPDFCPSREYCQRVHFSDAIHCDGETTSFKSSKDNWGRISCKNDLREQIDSGMPVDAVEQPPPPIPTEHIYDTYALPSEEQEMKNEADEVADEVAKEDESREEEDSNPTQYQQSR